MVEDNRGPTIDDSRRAQEEHAKAVDEWTDIELKWKDGPPSQQIQEDDSEGEANGTVENHELFDEEIFQNDLWKRIFTMNIETAKADARAILLASRENAGSYSSYPFSGLLFLRRCVCRFRTFHCCSSPASGVETTAETVKNDRLREQREILVALANTPFAAASIDHWHLLCDFYRKAAAIATSTPVLPDCPRSGPHWGTVGFQGMDPTTDFRGVGILGLLQLHLLVTEWGLGEDHLSSILTLSNHPQQASYYHFPFAVVGLNLSSLIITRLKTGDLNGLANVNDSFLSVINGIYKGAFSLFYRDWKGTGKTILDFQWAITKIDRVLSRDPSNLLNMQWIESPPQTPPPPLPPLRSPPESTRSTSDAGSVKSKESNEK